MAIKPVQILITAKDKASGVFDLLKKNALSLGTTVAAYFGARSFLGAIQGAAEFEAKLSEVRAVTQGSAADMAQLRKAAEDAGATTKFSASEAADALGNLARSGLTAQQAIAALPATLQLAQAGKIDLAQAADIVTQGLVSFRLAASEAGRVADVLALGANASKTSVTGLGQALSYAAPSAVSLGLSLESTVALIGKFADAGVDASRAGTALNAILSQFSDPASKFRGELAAIGITTNDFELALRQMAAAGPGAEKAILAVGLEAAPALRGALNLGIAALDDLKGKLDGAAGSAKDFATTVEDNFSGAASNMASAWDTVKLALATPVLPVLREGMQQLTGVLRGAVDSGTVGKFGDAIAKGFQAALEWGRRFLAEVDVDAMVAKMQSGADRVGAAFDQVSRYATNAGNTVQTVWGVMGAGVNVVLTGIYALGTTFAATAAAIVKGAAVASEALAKIAITDSAKTKLLDDAAAMREVLTGLEGVTQEFVAKANESMESVATNAQLAREGWAGLTDASTEAAKQAGTSQKVFQQVGETLKEVGGDATAAGQKQVAAAILQTEAARKTRAEVEALKREYEAALQAGDVQAALGKLQQMQTALRNTAGEAENLKKKAEDAAKQVANAFSSAGIKTKDQLNTLAENARRDFELIKGSGQATADGISKAWKSAADAAIAAGDGVVPAWVRAQAEAKGYAVVLDEAGKATLRLKTATDGARDAANGAAGGYRNMANSAAAAAEAAKRLAEINARYSRPGDSPSDPKDPGRGSPYARPGDPKPVNKDGQTQAEYQRAQRLAGQNAVDNTLMFELRDKLDAGLLTDADAGAIKSVVDALKQNEQVNRFIDRVNPSAFSLGGAADRNEWNAVLARLEQSLSKLGGGGGVGVGRTYRVDLPTDRGREVVNTDEAGAQAIIRSLGAARRSTGLR